MEESPIGSHVHDLGNEPQRRDERDSLLVLARLRLMDGMAESETVRVRNVSSGGLMAQASDQYRIGAAVEVELDGIGVMVGTVAWAEAGRIGIAFDHPIDKARARKPKTDRKSAAEDMIFRPTQGDYRRPPVKPR